MKTNYYSKMSIIIKDKCGVMGAEGCEDIYLRESRGWSWQIVYSVPTIFDWMNDSYLWPIQSALVGEREKDRQSDRKRERHLRSMSVVSKHTT